MLKKALLLAADSRQLENLVSTNSRTKKLVSRFVAGTTLESAVEATKEMNARGIDVTFDLLGETVEHLEEATDALTGYQEAIPAIARECPGSTLSVKLSQLAIGLDPEVCAGHLDALIQSADEAGVELEIDMEHSSVGRPTLEAFRSVLERYPNTRVAIQAMLRSAPHDLDSFASIKPRIRLVKGAFLEDPELALQNHDDVTQQYIYLAEWALQHLPQPAFGTHDDVCIDHIKKTAVRLGIDRSEYEFQMLYGVRRDLQQKLADEGYRVRVYMPYGTDWYSYTMRRMAEKPGNLMVFLRSLVSG